MKFNLIDFIFHHYFFFIILLILITLINIFYLIYYLDSQHTYIYNEINLTLYKIYYYYKILYFYYFSQLTK